MPPSLSLWRLHTLYCPRCKGIHKNPCLDGWRLFEDSARIIAGTRDEKRAQA